MRYRLVHKIWYRLLRMTARMQTRSVAYRMQFPKNETVLCVP